MVKATVILENRHRFKNDPERGTLVTDYWSSGLTTKQIKNINSRLVGTNDVTLEKFSDDKCRACYACPTHVMRSSIHATMQRNHVLRTHPLFNQTETNAPTHTIIVEANMISSEHHAAKTN